MPGSLGAIKQRLNGEAATFAVYADQRLRKPDSPEDPSNRRISLIVQYLVKNVDEDDAKPGAEGESKEGASKEGGSKHEGGAPKQEASAAKHEGEPAQKQ